MPKNRLEDLRNHLFDTIEQLKDKEKPMDLDRARAVADVASVILDSAKVEVAFMRATGSDAASDFIGEPVRRLPAVASKELPAGKGVQCIDCGERYPDKDALEAHRKRIHRSLGAA